MADISFLQPVIDGYKLGVFDDIKSVRIRNALDSLSQYGQVRQYYPEVTKTPKRKRGQYTKRSAYWQEKGKHDKPKA